MITKDALGLKVDFEVESFDPVEKMRNLECEFGNNKNVHVAVPGTYPISTTHQAQLQNRSSELELGNNRNAILGNNLNLGDGSNEKSVVLDSSLISPHIDPSFDVHEDVKEILRNEVTHELNVKGDHKEILVDLVPDVEDPSCPLRNNTFKDRTSGATKLSARANKKRRSSYKIRNSLSKVSHARTKDTRQNNYVMLFTDLAIQLGRWKVFEHEVDAMLMKEEMKELSNTRHNLVSLKGGNIGNKVISNSKKSSLDFTILEEEPEVRDFSSVKEEDGICSTASNMTCCGDSQQDDDMGVDTQKDETTMLRSRGIFNNRDAECRASRERILKFSSPEIGRKYIPGKNFYKTDNMADRIPPLPTVVDTNVEKSAFSEIGQFFPEKSGAFRRMQNWLVGKAQRLFCQSH